MKSFIVFVALIAFFGVAMATVTYVRSNYGTYPASYGYGYDYRYDYRYSYPYSYNYGYRYPWYSGYTSYSKYPVSAYRGNYYPHVNTLGGYYSYVVNPAYSDVILKKK